MACRNLGTEGLCRLIHRISYTLPKIIRVLTVDTETDGPETPGAQASIYYFANNLDEIYSINFCYYCIFIITLQVFVDYPASPTSIRISPHHAKFAPRSKIRHL